MSAGHRAGSQLMETLSLATIRGHPSLNQHADPLWNAGYICWATHFSSSEAPWGFFFFFNPKSRFILWHGFLQSRSVLKPTPPTHHLLPMNPHSPPTPFCPWLPPNSLQLFLFKWRALNSQAPLRLLVTMFSQISCYLASIRIGFKKKLFRRIKP